MGGGTACRLVTLQAVPHARMYEVQSKTDAGRYVSAGLFSSTRQMIVTGLTPGTNYTFQVRALGGSTGQSEWSNPVSHMSLYARWCSGAG